MGSFSLKLKRQTTGIFRSYHFKTTSSYKRKCSHSVLFIKLYFMILWCEQIKIDFFANINSPLVHLTVQSFPGTGPVPQGSK